MQNSPRRRANLLARSFSIDTAKCHLKYDIQFVQRELEFVQDFASIHVRHYKM